MAKRFTVNKEIKESSLIDEANNIRREFSEAEKLFNDKIKAIYDKCTHKWDDSTDATFETRYSYNNYGTECEICGRRIK